jgi:hypothetical protein
LFVLIFYLLSPLPMMISKNIYGCDSNQPSACSEFAFFTTAIIVFSAFGLPFVLAHAGAVSFLSKP